jgi:hypothetical protein
MLKDNDPLTDDELTVYGNNIGIMLMMSKNQKRRWKTHYGDKENIGLARTILNIASIMQNRGRI